MGLLDWLGLFIFILVLSEAEVLVLARGGVHMLLFVSRVYYYHVWAASSAGPLVDILERPAFLAV